MVHGFDHDSALGCPWGSLMEKFRDWGYTGPFVPVRYYKGDKPCTARGNTWNWTIDHHGSHSASAPGHDLDTTNQDDPFGGHHENAVSHNTNAPIGHLGNHFAWFIFEHFTKKGKWVNVAAHSMGGLITRHAIDSVQKRRPGYPPHLLVRTVTTMGSPHSGIDDELVWFCAFIGNPLQCQQMKESSGFISYLRTKARNPQGAFGTFWAVAGSHDDNLVDEASALDMSVQYKIRWGTSVNIEHADYFNERVDDDPPFVIGARCRGTSSGQDYDDMGPWGNCWWPLQWYGAILLGPL